MFGWFGQKPKIIQQMIQLRAPPIGDNGSPAWTDEIENITKGLGREFLAPIMYETSPGQCLGGFVARAFYDSRARTYEGRAILLQTKTDDFRSTTVVTAPSAAPARSGDLPWDSYRSQFSGTLQKTRIEDIVVRVVRGLCKRAHDEELQERRKRRDELLTRTGPARAAAPTGPRGLGGFAQAYDHNNPDHLTAMLRIFHETLHDAQNDPETLDYYASFVCGVAVLVRERVGVDLGTLVFPIQAPPLPPSHPMPRALAVLDGTIAKALEWLRSAAPNDPRGPDMMAFLQAKFLWKGYLSALNTPPAMWAADAAYALRSLAILARANASAIISRIRDGTNGIVQNFFDASTRNQVHDMDWPPRGCLEFCRQNIDLLEEKCGAAFGIFGGVLMSRDSIDAIKDVARDNTRRERERLEQSPRASRDEIVRKADEFSLLGLRSTYSTMRRDDFCDVIIAALTSGKLSGQEASQAIYAREWVLTGGDERLSLPEWLEAEGAERVMELNREWLASGKRDMSFNDWYAYPQ